MQALAKQRSTWRSHVDRWYQQQHKEHYESTQKRRQIRKRIQVGQYECSFPGCLFTHDQLRYVKSHEKQKHTQVALQRQQNRAERIAAALPANATAALCPVCGKTLKCGTTGDSSDWKGVRIHLAKAHKFDRQQQNTQIEQLGGIPRPARCSGGRPSGEPLVGGEEGGRRGLRVEGRNGNAARGRVENG